ncbi:MAG: epoxyqueuosine reductase QueH [Coriobacteriia bacterium]|nr:epoxyqueuosine reductase QueH [Coriobacteriia bacterium]
MSTPTQHRPHRLLLHACCGPCLLEPLDALVAEADEVVIAFANPNIHPADEYERRRDTLIGYAAEVGVDVVELPYAPQVWEAAVAPLADAGAERCRACYRLRLGLAAQMAADGGFDALATTLSVSPYQDQAAINAEGRRAAAAAGVQWLDRDFRERYRDATTRSRELGMYRQNYCGCVFSQSEASAERQARKDARAAEKAARKPPSQD